MNYLTGPLWWNDDKRDVFRFGRGYTEFILILN